MMVAYPPSREGLAAFDSHPYHLKFDSDLCALFTCLSKELMLVMFTVKVTGFILSDSPL